MVKRRTFIRSASLACLSLVGGCPSLEGELRGLTLHIESTTETSGGYEILGEVSSRAEGRDREWRTFHRVRVVGYTNDGTDVCREKIGKLSGIDEASFRLECSDLPAQVVVEAAESPCATQTYLDRAISVETTDGETAWRIEDRPCSES